MTDVAEAGTRSVVVEADLDYSPDKVWFALTDSESIAVWMMSNDLKPEVGYKFTFRARPIERWDGEFQCEVLEVEPERKLSYSWKGGHPELKGFGKYIETVATWTLTPLPDGKTHLRFEHGGFSTAADADGVFETMSKGAQSVVKALAKRIPDLTT